MIYFVIINYGNVKKKKKKLKTLISHHRNVHHIKGTSQQTKCPLGVGNTCNKGVQNLSQSVQKYF